jgi:hypothetical protein
VHLAVAVRRLVTAVAVVGLTVVGAVVPTTAWACSCVYSKDAPEHIGYADVIFTGTIQDSEHIGKTRWITFAVDRVYKGEAAAVQDVATRDQPASCGLAIKGPRSFVVFADRARSGDTLTASSCGGTRAGQAPASLGAGWAAHAGEARRPPRPAVWVVVLLTVAAGGIALIARRRRRAALAATAESTADDLPAAKP